MTLIEKFKKKFGSPTKAYEVVGGKDVYWYMITTYKIEEFLKEIEEEHKDEIESLEWSYAEREEMVKE